MENIWPRPVYRAPQAGDRRRCSSQIAQQREGMARVAKDEWGDWLQGDVAACRGLGKCARWGAERDYMSCSPRSVHDGQEATLGPAHLCRVVIEEDAHQAAALLPARWAALCRRTPSTCRAMCSHVKEACTRSRLLHPMSRARS